VAAELLSELDNTAPCTLAGISRWDDVRKKRGKRRGGI